MVQNPKYDNDAVNLGYLNKRLKQSEKDITTDNNNSISKIPKNYSIPPNPPYYKDSLLCYKNKIYKCNTTKLSGVFSWNDWSIAATDDTTVSDFINNIYELEKLEIQEQIDGKIQTYYQEMDPSNEWKTDLEKAKHIGDYWYNITNNTQWRYNRNTDTTPITYGWGQVNVPNSVFDLIDKKKSIYTIKPTSYKKDDLWIIEDTLSDEDLPNGTEENPIAKGDWVFSVANSDTYNKEHWVKRDEDVSLSYLEQHYYTMGDIDSSFEELERSTDSKITKAKEEINLNVSQKYTTKEEHKAAINDFDEQIGTINNTLTTHETNISDLNVGVGKISASVESVKSKTKELSVDIDGVKENIIPTSTSSGSNIHIEDASDKKMVNFEIEGKSTQKTRNGKNLFNKENNIVYSNVKPTKTVLDTGVRIVYNYSGGYPLALIEIGNLSDYLGKTVRIKTKGIPSSSNKFAVGLYISNNDNSKRDSLSTSSYYNESELLFEHTLDNSYDSSYTKLLVGLRTSSTTSTSDYVDFTNLIITVDNDDMTYEPYGVSPSPDYPSEIESAGYRNLFDEQYEIGQINVSTGNNSSSTTKIRTKNYISIQPGKSYTLSNESSTETWGIYYDKNKNYIGYIKVTNNTLSETITTPDNAYYIRWHLVGITDTIYQTILTKGTQKRSYIPYGKYGIEVKNTGKNLFNKETTISGKRMGLNGIPYSDEKYFLSDYIEIKPNTTYTVNYEMSVYTRIAFYDADKNYVAQNTTNSTFTTSSSSCYLRLGQLLTEIDNTQLEEGNKSTEVEEYKSNTSLFVLDQPLRSLPNGVKDIAYIKNNILYVDRKVGNVVLDGSETIVYSTSGTFSDRFKVDIGKKSISEVNVISNYFTVKLGVGLNNENKIGLGNDSNIYFEILREITSITDSDNSSSKLTKFKNFLSTHNTQVDYELAETYTEKIGEVEIPSTFKGVNNIITTDELEPVMNIEYVRDTILSDYVEGQVSNAVAIQERKNAEFQITNEEIKSSVSNISTDLDGTKSSLNSVEEKITSQEKTIKIISKNIDGTTGEIREVTTTTGFTFNAEGLTIDDGAGYKAQHTAQGTFYKDGDSITGQYTKDGSKQKDLELFGTYSYGKENIGDTPMFIAQLYTDENGEQCFGHFYNGGDY